jgi:hypothetical protein
MIIDRSVSVDDRHDRGAQLGAYSDERPQSTFSRCGR